jgi:hypothetical protein
MGSTPRKPASFTSFIFSSTEPFTPTVLHMMAFLIARGCAAARREGALAVARSVVARNWRRFIIGKWGREALAR